jgi:hypothetical protein
MDLKTDSLSKLWIGTVYKKDDILNSLSLLTDSGMTEEQSIIHLKKIICIASSIGEQKRISDLTVSVLSLCGYK